MFSVGCGEFKKKSCSIFCRIQLSFVWTKFIIYISKYAYTYLNMLNYKPLSDNIRVDGLTKTAAFQS